MGGGGGLSLCVINYYFVDVCLFYIFVIRRERGWGMSSCVINYYFVDVGIFYFFVIRGGRGWGAVIMRD